MLIFFDTEFTELGKNPKLISIGMVAENGREFYAELTDGYEADDCSDFVQDSVLPHLEGGDARMTFRQCATRLVDWLKSFQEPIQFATDSRVWDWPWITELLAKTDYASINLAKRPVFLYDMIDTDFLESTADMLFESHASTLRRHHALDDAKVNHLCWQAWNEHQSHRIKSN